MSSPLDLLNKIIGAVIAYRPKNKTKKARKARKVAHRKKIARGRDASYLAPPAQNRTGPIRAYGFHLGYLTANRTSGQG